jgi:fucose permease
MVGCTTSPFVVLAQDASGAAPDARVTALAIAGAFAFGMVLTLLGSIKLALGKRFGLDEARVGGLLSALNLALIPMMLLSGLLIDAWGVQEVMVAGGVVTAASLFSLTFRKSYGWALACILGAGLGGAALSTASVVLMPGAFFGEQHETASLNLGNVFFGLGALLTPTLADLLLRTVRFRWTLGILALACLVPAGIALATPHASLLVTQQQGDLMAVAENPLLWLAGLVFFLYGPVEFAIGTWATTYLTQFGYREQRAAWLLSAFWLAFFGARLLMAFLVHQTVLPAGAEAWIILFLALLSAVALGNLAGAASKGSAGVGLLILGALMGPIFPTLVGIVFHHFPDHKGTAYGAMFAIGSVGSLIFAPLIGVAARRTNIQQALRIPMILALLLTGAALVLGLAR